MIEEAQKHSGWKRTFPTEKLMLAKDIRHMIQVPSPRSMQRCSSWILIWSCIARNVNLDQVGEQDAYWEIIKTKTLGRQTSPTRFCENSKTVPTFSCRVVSFKIGYPFCLRDEEKILTYITYLRFCLIFQKIEETDEVTERMSQNFLIFLELSVLPFENGVHELYQLVKL